MKISEQTYTVNQHGNLKIPAKELKAMSLFSGMNVRVAFLTEDGEENTFREFMLSKDSLADIHAETHFSIPIELLRQANIPEDDDVQIIAADGAILICREPSLNTQELASVFDSLHLAECLTEQLPDDLHAATEQLRLALNNFMNEEMINDERNADCTARE